MGVCPRLCQRQGDGDSSCVIADAKHSFVSHSLKDYDMSLYVFVCVLKKQSERELLCSYYSCCQLGTRVYVYLCACVCVREKQSACIHFLQPLSVCISALLCVLDTYGLCMTLQTGYPL